MEVFLPRKLCPHFVFDVVVALSSDYSSLFGVMAEEDARWDKKRALGKLNSRDYFDIWNSRLIDRLWI